MMNPPPLVGKKGEFYFYLTNTIHYFTGTILLQSVHLPYPHDTIQGSTVTYSHFTDEVQGGQRGGISFANTSGF